MNSKSKSAFTLTIERPAYGDLSIGRHKGKVVLVSGVYLPGEEVDIVIEKEKKDYISASVKKLIHASPDRVPPECAYFGHCGGCHLQHIPYKHQVLLKETIISDCLKRIGKIEIPLADPLVLDYPWKYRSRAQFKIRDNNIGFYRSKTHDVIHIDHCPLVTPEVDQFYEKARTIISSNRFIKELHIVCGDSAVALVRLNVSQKSAPDLEGLAVQFTEAGFSGIIMETKDEERFGYGKTFTTLDLLDLKYSVSPSCFFQSNWNLNIRLVEHIRNALAPLNDLDILDLYAGSGNFSLPLSDAYRVVAIEENKAAIENGKQSIELNALDNIKFIRSDAEKYQTDDHFEVVLLDPPRAGLKEKVIRNILSMMPEKIVYISCNPTTLARDLKKFTEKYDIESVRLVDFFPQTYHIESLVFLSKR